MCQIKRKQKLSSRFKEEGKKKKSLKIPQNSQDKMHMAHILMTEWLVDDSLITDKALYKQPRESRPSWRSNVTKAFSSDTKLSSPRSIFGHYYCSKFSVYQIYKSQRLPPHCSIKSLSFSYCSSFSNTRDEQQPNYIPLSST